MARKFAIDVDGSSCVGHAEYDPESPTLEIHYIGGGTYEYERVPPDTVEALRAAELKGQFVNAVIKPRFRYRRRT